MPKSASLWVTIALISSLYSAVGIAVVSAVFLFINRASDCGYSCGGSILLIGILAVTGLIHLVNVAVIIFHTPSVFLSVIALVLSGGLIFRSERTMSLFFSFVLSLLTSGIILAGVYFWSIIPLSYSRSDTSNWENVLLYVSEPVARIIFAEKIQIFNAPSSVVNPSNNVSSCSELGC